MSYTIMRSSGIVVYAMICLTDVCAMLHFVMLYHFARYGKTGCGNEKNSKFFPSCTREGGREGGREEGRSEAHSMD